MCGGFVVDVIPCDHIAPAAGGGATNGEDESLIEGSPQQLQDPFAL